MSSFNTMTATNLHLFENTFSGCIFISSATIISQTLITKSLSHHQGQLMQ